MQLHRARERFDQAGADLVLIGQATPRHAAHFARRLELEHLRVLADEDRVTYRAAELPRANVAQLIGPRSVARGIRHAARSGVVQGRTVGDTTQLGGAAVIAPGGEVRLRHASQHAGDTASVDSLLAAV